MLAYTYLEKGKFELMEKPKPVLLQGCYCKSNTCEHLLK